MHEIKIIKMKMQLLLSKRKDITKCKSCIFNEKILLEIVHVKVAHSSALKMLNIIFPNYYCPNMIEDINQNVINCHICKKRK